MFVLHTHSPWFNPEYHIKLGLGGSEGEGKRSISVPEGDSLPDNDKLHVLSLDSAVELATGRVIREYADNVVEVKEGVVNDKNIYFVRHERSPGDQGPNSAKSVHSNLFSIMSQG